MAVARVTKIDVVDGIRWITVRCPYCGREHFHEGGTEKEDLSLYLGHRLSRCRGREKKQYRIVPYEPDNQG
jgi:hypothetical protein